MSEPVQKAPLFEFHATLTALQAGLDTLHGSMELVRQRAGRHDHDLSLLQFELALAEIGANVLQYALPPDSAEPRVEYQLTLETETLTGLLTDWGPPLHNPLTTAMPDTNSEAGRGLALARKVLDELGYQREGEVNTWRLVKRL